MSAPLPSDRWARVTELFEAAVSIAPAARAAWLERQCGGDLALRREVESLLTADAGSGTDAMLANAVSGALVDAAASAAPPTVQPRLDRYRILRKIGHGGMATVFLAVRDDDEFDQRVAIKVVRGALGADTLRRFRAERQILASLEHPSIARLIDGGTTADELPYLVMEYVDGVPIDQYCADRRLSIDERLRLFSKVCEAVGYAHRSFVVHRDIKPSNILVTHDGLPKLLDFGIAKLRDDAEHGAPPTRTGMRALTPEYASPEQVRGEPITTASDVYSLGVLLYELLTGTRPLAFETQQPSEIERVVCTVEPRKPSTVAPAADARQLAGDLDTIVLAALAKEPARRYQSPSQLAEDLQRYLEGLPIVARPATWRYRSSRFVRRHRAGVAVAAMMGVLVVGFTIALALQVRRVSRERDTARQVSDLLLDLYATFDPSESRGSLVTAQDVLDRGAARIEAELRDQPAVQANLLDAIGALYLDVALPDRALDVFEKALAIRRNAGIDETLEAARTFDGMANALRERARFADAEGFARQSLDIRRRLGGPRSGDTADSLSALGILLFLRGQPFEGAALVLESIEIRREVNGADSPEFAAAMMNIVRFWRDRADHLTTERFSRADLLRAERFERERLAIRRKAFGDAHTLTTNSLVALGMLLRMSGRAQEAEPLLREGLELRRQVFGRDAHASVIESTQALALVLQDLGHYDEANRWYERGRELRAQVPNAANARSTHRAVDYANRATLLEAIGRPDAAAAEYREAIAMLRQSLEPDHPLVARVLDQLATLLLKEHRAAEALPCADEALSIRLAKLGPDDYETAVSTATRAKILLALGRGGEAAPLLRSAYAVRAAALPKEDARLREDARLLASLQD